MREQFPFRTRMHAPSRCSWLIAIALAAAGAVPVAAQSVERPHHDWRIGVHGALSLNPQSAEFQAVPGYPGCSPGYTRGGGLGLAAGILGELALSERLLLGLRLGYAGRSTTLRSREEITVVVDGREEGGLIEHSVESSVGSFSLEPSLGIRLGRVVSLFGGVRLGLVGAATFAQQEELQKPDWTGTFGDGRRVRNDTSGTLPGAAGSELGITFGIRAEVPLNRSRSLLLAPELIYAHGLSTVIDDIDWRSHSIRLGASLLLGFTGRTDLASDIIAPADSGGAPADSPDDTLRLWDVRAVPSSISAVALTPSGESERFTVRVEEFIASTMNPLLPYLFFAE